jgi:hypothetical protein
LSRSIGNDVCGALHVNKITALVTGQSVLKEVIIIDAVKQRREHGCSYGKAADAQYCINPVVTYVTQSGFKVMDNHCQDFY